MANSIVGGLFFLDTAAGSTPAMTFVGKSTTPKKVVVSGAMTAGTVTIEGQTKAMFARDPNDFVAVDGGVFDANSIKAIDVTELSIRVTADGSFASTGTYVELS